MDIDKMAGFTNDLPTEEGEYRYKMPNWVRSHVVNVCKKNNELWVDFSDLEKRAPVYPTRMSNIPADCLWKKI